jgi:acyl phosphate:glycerol-3-phosphate acyltransferase
VALFPALAAAGTWIVVFLATRYASVASLAGAVALPAFAVLFGSSWPVLAFTAGAAVAIILLHRTNIARLLAGEEHRIELRRRRAPTVGAGGSGTPLHSKRA